MNKIKSKKIIVVSLMGVFLFGAIYSGVSRNRDELHKNNKKQNAMEEVKEKIENNKKEDTPKEARYIQYKLDNKLLEKDVYDAMENKKLSWWIKRNNDHVKSEYDTSINLNECGAYCVDERVYDASSKKYNEKVMYLTFDCGYDNGLTEKILDVLKEYNVPACFFVTKTYIRDNIELTKRMKAEGHQVGNHTCMHPSLPDENFDKIVEEIDGCATYMKEATGYEMDPYFRPPKGEYSKRVLNISKDMGYKNIFWSIVYYDYDLNKQPGKDYVINHFEKFNHSGAIILMHNISSSNEEALETVIKNMIAKGYRFASLNELE